MVIPYHDIITNMQVLASRRFFSSLIVASVERVCYAAPGCDLNVSNMTNRRSLAIRRRSKILSNHSMIVVHTLLCIHDSLLVLLIHIVMSDVALVSAVHAEANGGELALPLVNVNSAKI